ncbi:hypothetical protein ACFL3C_02060 [Patescibacteria group bacterium]
MIIELSFLKIQDLAKLYAIVDDKDNVVEWTHHQGENTEQKREGIVTIISLEAVNSGSGSIKSFDRFNVEVNIAERVNEKETPLSVVTNLFKTFGIFPADVDSG